MSIIEKPLELLRKNVPAFQRYIDHHHSNDAVFIPAENNYIVWDPETDCKYMLDANVRVIDEVKHHYDFSGLTKNDVVLDIGANIGAVSIPLSKKVKWVYAIEPIFTDHLLKNIEMNNCKNITVIPYGLGTKHFVNVTYENRTKMITCFSLSALIEMCDLEPTFIKMDCEGRASQKSGEWCITHQEIESLKSVWGLELEIHCYECEPIDKFINMLQGFEHKTDKFQPQTETVFDLAIKKHLPVAWLIHARRKVK